MINISPYIPSYTASCLWSVAYYDDRGRPVQTAESVQSGGYRREYYAYDFTGAVTGRKSVLTPSSGAAVTVVQTFTYDPMGRPVSVTHKVGDLEPRTVSLKAYDEIGRLSSEQRNSLASLLETRSYNLRSWLTGIDCPLFKESLRYQDGTTPQWGGNISEMSWGLGTASKNYRFGYDALSRLISADYSEGSAQASANARAGGLIGGGGIIGGEIASGGHSESYHYDRNGNMDMHGRDNLMELIGVEGNRITSVGSKAISYDAKGRQISSTYGKAVATQYNILDLPQKHTLSSADTEIDYKYSADGRKLQEKVSQGSSQTSRDYLGEFIYENGTLKKILFDGGYVDMIGDAPVYMFFIKDHLGSVRAVVSETGEVLQTNEFYPYGDMFSSAGTADTSSNRYRFTGKELGDETGLYDFSARYLHTSLGRFTTLDPLAEKYPSISPYAYCNGNPVNFVDPDGMDWLKNMETWQYEWRDDIQADSEIPDGYRYVGATSNDILNDLNICTGYRIQDSNVFYVAGEIESGGLAISAVNKRISANMRVSVQLSYDDENASSNNLLGIMFEGITFTASSIQASIDANNPFMRELAALFEISYGNETFSEIMKEPTGSYIKETGTKVLSGSINIPASKFAPNMAFGNATIKSGIKDIAMYFRNSQISWPIEKWPMFRPKK